MATSKKFFASLHQMVFDPIGTEKRVREMAILYNTRSNRSSAISAKQVGL